MKIDWDTLEEYFVRHTDASMTYRTFAETVTPTLAATNYEGVNYEMVRERGKSHRWMQKRAKFLIENNPGVFQDIKAIYSILRAKLVDEDNTDATVGDITRLASEFRAYAEMVQAAESVAPEEFSGVTRDEVISIMDDYVSQNSAIIMERAVEVMEEKLPNELPE